jgi:hypothetical protein
MDASMTYKHNFLLKTGAAPYGKFGDIRFAAKFRKKEEKQSWCFSNYFKIYFFKIIFYNKDSNHNMKVAFLVNRLSSLNKLIRIKSLQSPLA